MRTTKIRLLYKDIKRDRFLYLMLLPVLIHYIIFAYIPMYGITVAFKDYRIDLGILGSPWAGLKYFRSFFNSVFFGRLTRNTFLINFYGLIWGMPVPILFALAINEMKNSVIKKMIQTVSYFPYFISTVVLVGIVTTFLNPVDGVMFKILGIFGIQPYNIMSNPKLFRSIYISSGIWQGFGWSSIVYLAAISGINPELYESAAIDGINRFKRILYITLPCIRPTIIILLILSIGNLFSVGTEKIILMINPLTYETGDVLSSFVFRRGIQNMEVSLTTAVGLFNNIINFLLLITANKTAKIISETSLW